MNDEHTLVVQWLKRQARELRRKDESELAWRFAKAIERGDHRLK
jgi:hypothetical protein